MFQQFSDIWYRGRLGVACWKLTRHACLQRLPSYLWFSKFEGNLSCWNAKACPKICPRGNTPILGLLILDLGCPSFQKPCIRLCVVCVWLVISQTMSWITASWPVISTVISDYMNSLRLVMSTLGSSCVCLLSVTPSPPLNHPMVRTVLNLYPFIFFMLQEVVSAFFPDHSIQKVLIFPFFLADY